MGELKGDSSFLCWFVLLLCYHLLTMMEEGTAKTAISFPEKDNETGTDLEIIF